MYFRKPEYMRYGEKGLVPSSFSSVLKAMLLFIIGTIVASFIQSPILLWRIFGNPEYMELIRNNSLDYGKISEVVNKILSNTTPFFEGVMMIGNIGIAIVVLIYWKGIRKRNPKEIGLTGNVLYMLFLGIIIGACVALAITGVLVAFHTIDYKGINTSFITPSLIVLFIAYMLKGFAEELLCRGFLFSSCCERYSVLFSVVVNSIFFSLFHISNVEANFSYYINMILLGILLSMLVIAFDNIYIAASFNGVFGFMNNVIFGFIFENDKNNNMVFKFLSHSGADSVFNGGKEGIYAGSVMTVILAISIICMYYVLYLRGKINTLEEETKARNERMDIIFKRDTLFFKEQEQKINSMLDKVKDEEEESDESVEKTESVEREANRNDFRENTFRFDASYFSEDAANEDSVAHDTANEDTVAHDTANDDTVTDDITAEDTTAHDKKGE